MLSTVEAVRAARNPQEAMLALAGALDAVLERLATQPAAGAWGDWTPAEAFGAPAAQTAAPVRIEQPSADHVDLIFQEPSPEKAERRRLFERQQLKIGSMLEGEPGVPDDVDWNRAYANGGPLWLYHGNRDLVMTYPESTRREMVRDVLEDSPEAAHEMAIDILKQPAGEPDLENGSGALAVGEINGRSLR